MAVDPEHLEWLGRTPIGRSFNREIGALLATRMAVKTAAAASVTPVDRRSRRLRRR